MGISDSNESRASVSKSRTGRHLDPAVRAALVDLVTSRPDLSRAQVARLMEVRYGVRVCRTTVLAARRGYSQTRPANHLAPALRAARDEIVIELAGAVSWAEMARRFEAATGRSLDRRNLARRAIALGAGRRKEAL